MIFKNLIRDLDKYYKRLLNNEVTHNISYNFLHKTSYKNLCPDLFKWTPSFPIFYIVKSLIYSTYYSFSKY